jgi:hypothetical protein
MRRPVPERTGGAAPIPSAPNGSMLPIPPPPFPVVASASGVEVVSSDSAVLSARVPSELSESALVPLVSQFSMMQQQMFDQFQQAMGMLVQMFSTMHREQMDVIREELDRLHELTRELQELKEELARAPSRTAATASEPAAPAVPILPATGPVRAPTVGTPASAGAPTPSVAGPDRPLTTAKVPPPRTTVPRPDHARAGLGPPVTDGDAGASDGARDAVTWIHQRIAAIQQERETRWQKIIKLLPGMS